ncbi:hypothetical protein DPMN_155660 [Dreissena polymorpha]|nr:hypothetical protein DPMN_155660 [Dreissena polymorpha]
MVSEGKLSRRQRRKNTSLQGKNLQAVGSVRERRIVSQRPTEEMQWHLWTKCMNVAHLMSF